MKFKDFCLKSNFSTLGEIEKVVHLSFYLLKVEGITEFTISFIAERLDKEGFFKPNQSRLKNKLLSSKNFLKGNIDGNFKLHFNIIQSLEKKFLELSEEDDDVINNDAILPRQLYQNTRGFIELISKEINASYENNIFDGSAVLMRRLIEILLIMSYDHKKRINEILETTGEYKNLNFIINYSLSNNVLSVSKDSRDVLDDFRQLGNFSAHKIQYNCKRNDIKKVILKFRLAVEELLYECGIKK